VSISHSNFGNKATARDPVSDAAPIEAWVSNNLIRDTTPSAALTVTVLTTLVGDAGDFQTVFVSAPLGDLQRIANYYVGLIGTGNVAPGNVHRVVGYRYLGTTGVLDRGEFVFSGAFPLTTGTIVLDDPTDLTIPAFLQVFVPAGRTGVNSYPGPPSGCAVLYNETRTQFAPVTDYSFTTHLLQVDASSIVGFAWLATDSYSIRCAVPMSTTPLAAPRILSTTVFSLPVTAPNTDNALVGDFIRIIDCTSPPVVPVAPPTGESRRINRYVALDSNLVNATPEANPNAFTLTSGSTTNGFYVGAHLVIPGVPEYYVIDTYTFDPVTQVRSGTVTIPILAHAAGTPVFIRSAFVNPAFSALPTVTDCFEILSFSRDNYNTLMYSGSIVSQSEMVCYEIELMNLVLPNRTLAVGQGSRIAFYPYVYVELTNVSAASAGTRNILYSNNPNSYRMLFRAPIDDIPNPVVSSFIKIDSDGTVQTVKFKPNDTLHFSVTLPNGQLYETILTEDFSPLPPNAENQISALFAIKRL
jgi:hypothetical protein